MMAHIAVVLIEILHCVRASERSHGASLTILFGHE